MTSRKYHSLLVKDVASDPWMVHFGDYDRDVVMQEGVDLWDSSEPYAWTIITTDDNQASIMQALTDLNG